MGAACQKQFQNIPDTSPIYQQQQYEHQLNRMSTNSIKQQHRTVRPNNKSVQIGMINTKLGTYYLPNNQYSTVNNYVDNVNVNNRSSIYASNINNNINKSNINTNINTNNYEQLTLNNTFKDIDRQQLHATKRPSQAVQTVLIGSRQNTHIYPKQKQIQPLDLNFYYSLALPQYHYHEIPEQYKKQYQNLIVCEQQQRNGVKYIGEWKDQKTIHGNGVLQSNTSKYIGQFRNGLKNFHGRQIWKYQVYQGMYENGRRKGYGTKYTPQSIQQGQFDEYIKKGKISYTNGNYYIGQLQNNLYNGKGQFYDAKNKVYYNGIYKNNKLNGYGQVRLHDRIVYKGNFKQGQRNGYGQFYWNSNDYYKGQYTMGKKNGYGQLLRGNINYKGMFKNGQIVNKYGYNNNSSNRLSQINDQNSIYSLDNDGLPEQWRYRLRRNKQQDQQSQIFDMSSRNHIINMNSMNMNSMNSMNMSNNNMGMGINKLDQQQKYIQQLQYGNIDDNDDNVNNQQEIDQQLQESSKRYNQLQNSHTIQPQQPQQLPTVPQPNINTSINTSQLNQPPKQQKQAQPITVPTQKQIAILGALGLVSPDKYRQQYIPNSQRYIPADNKYQGVLDNSSQSAKSDPNAPSKKVRPLEGYLLKEGINQDQLQSQRQSRIKGYQQQKSIIKTIVKTFTNKSINIQPEDPSRVSNLGQSQRFIKKQTGPVVENITPQNSQEFILTQQPKNTNSSFVLM